jgi:hypothetical protein
MNITDKFVEGFVEACYKSGLTEKQACVLMDCYVTQNNVDGIEKSADAKGLLKALLAVLGVGGLAYGADYLGTTNSPIGTWLRNNLGAGNWGIHKWVSNALGGASSGLASPEDTKLPKKTSEPHQSKSFSEAVGNLGNALINVPWKTHKTAVDTWNDAKHLAHSAPKVVGKAVDDAVGYVDQQAARATDWATERVENLNKKLWK